MGFSPAHIKRCTLTWEAPDYSTSYPAGYTTRGVAVIAVAEYTRKTKGYCYSTLTALVYISRENGERIVINQEPVVESCMHSLLDPCDVVHPKTLGRIVLNAWDVIPSDYTHHLVTVADDRHDLKLLFRNCRSEERRVGKEC